MLHSAAQVGQRRPLSLDYISGDASLDACSGQTSLRRGLTVCMPCGADEHSAACSLCEKRYLQQEEGVRVHVHEVVIALEQLPDHQQLVPAS